ncbi:translocation/assembly module TamB [Salinimicrobium tongyeongense]|uniref:Translocation/assembly module TamB n=1 Tax=Salinimicrobium tongyeongense TaxID=2809707 RepID=A0ABY6NQJ9_9FLAO|nr:translocation/assembly module TamB domain-containing protein [Salinimicrobium tongyeongense]UZH55162.1 translocation/assembly module TamB [Salinimicrobium tongyeongense]
MEANKNKKEKKQKGSGIRLFFKIILGIFIFIILLLLFIRSPWGQGIIVDKLVNYIENKTNTRVEVDRLFITFGGDLSVEGLFLEDEKGDTLLYSRELEADISLMPLINGNGFYLNSLDWNGGVANISRTDTIQGFNFSFLAEAFTSADTTAATKPADTSASAMEIKLGNIDLQDLRLSYNDQYLGIDAKIKLGKLALEMQKFNLDSIEFGAGDLILENTRFKYAQTKPAPESEEESEAPMPRLSAENLEVTNVAGSYTSVPGGIIADIELPEFILELPEADLQNNAVVVDRLSLNNSRLYVQNTASATSKTPDTTAVAEKSEAFEWPQWTVKAAQLSLENNHFRYWVNNKAATKGTFDPEAVGLQDFDLQIPELILENETLQAEVAALNFREASGILLNKTQFTLSVNKDRAALEDLLLRVNGNLVEGNLLVDYESLDSFINNPETATVDVNLPQFNVDLQDLYRFQPDLRQNTYFAALAKKGISGSLSAEGELSAVNIERANIDWGGSTSLAATGTIYNATDAENLRFDIPQLRLRSSRADLHAFIEEQNLGIELPEKLNLAGSFRGSPEDISVDAILNSSAGKVNVEGRFVTAPKIAFSTDLKVTELEVGQILQNKALGSLSLDIQARGSGDDVNSLNAVVDGTIGRFEYNQYVFNNINLFAEMEDGQGFANVAYKDDNLNMELESFVVLDSVAPEINLTLNIIGADLQALGLSANPVNAAMEVKGTFEGNAEKFDATATVDKGVFVYDNESYLLGDLDLLAHVTPDTTSLQIENRMLDLKLFSNAGPQDFIQALDRHYDSYFTSEEVLDTVANPVNIELAATVAPSPILEEVFLPQLEAFDTIAVKVDFSEREKTLVGSVEIPYLNYFGSEIDSLDFEIDSNPEELFFSFGLESLDAGPLAIKKTSLDGLLIDEELKLDFLSVYEEEPLMKIESSITRNDGIIRLEIAPDSLILNSHQWQIAPENEVLIGDSSYIFNNFRLSRDNQQLAITNDLPEVQKEHIGIEFQNFNLAALFSYLNPEAVLASGNINGDFIIEEPFEDTGLLADLTINDFGVMDVPLGQLSLDAEAAGFNTYELDMAVTGNANLQLTGSYTADAQGGNLDMFLDLERIPMEVVEGFSFGEINSTSGSLSGEFTVTGDPLAPNYDGALNFNDAQFRVAILDTPFSLRDETLRVDTTGVYMDNFEIRDVNNNAFVLNGAVLTESLINPEFDLSFTANNFTALNSTEEDFDLFYGKFVFDASGSVTGNLELPQVELDLEILDETNITYVIPEASVEIEEREGVVVFVNREDPNRILTRRSKDEEVVALSGFALNSYISLQEGATFNIVINEETGDHFQATGDGDILYDISPNGRTTMTGRVELSDGYYEMSLYNLVTRRFDIMDGSSIVWAGNPLDADLNITAVYEVEAAAAGLMASQLQGADLSDKDPYRQELDFLVYLKIGGEISAPKLSFGLDMPEGEQGSLGGQVYGRVQQINQQENELNKQVFSLLVLNRFFPTTGSDGSGGGTLSFARDNLNEALSDQLNIFSDRLLGETGVDLNFGLDTFTDYQGENPQERTQLDITAQKSFLDDRLVVSVGSEVDVQGSSPVEESTPLIGNVSLEYLLSPNGRYRLMAFRRSSYENVIDGQLIVSGLALIFTQEFNKFRELWNEVAKGDKAKKEESGNGTSEEKTSGKGKIEEENSAEGNSEETQPQE